MPPARTSLHPLNTRVLLGLGFALAILLAIGADSYRSTLALVENGRLVAHTHEVVSHLWTLSSDVVTAESRRRAYALTGDVWQVERERGADASARTHLRDLRRLTADNPRQQERLDRLEPLIVRRLAQIEELMDLRRQAPGDRETQAAAATAASQANDDIRAVIHEMLDEESMLLGQRDAGVAASVRRTRLVIVLGSIAACFLVVIAGLLFHRASVQRERAEEALRRSEALYRTVLRQFPNGAVLLYDRDLRYRLAEGKGLEEVGLSKAGLEGRTIWEALPPETCAAIEPHYRAALAGRATSFEAPFGGRHYAVHVSPLAAGEGEVTHGMVVSLDVTERKRAQDDVLRLNADLERKVAEATAANKELEGFSYSVSHDLRAPIRHINGFVDLLQRRLGSALDETARRHLDTIARASRHMGQLIDDLLAFSRTGRGDLMRSRVSLASLVREIVEGLRPETEGRSVEWKVNGLPEVTGDPALLRVALTNLVGNALKYTRPRPRAVIEIGRTAGNGDEVVVFVRDNGVGFDMQYADKLFGVFQRLHRAEHFEGTGIGLATVRRIVHRHGGRVWAQASVDGGATFYVALPARGAENR